jgi:CRISPR-associated protein Csm2
MDHSSTNRNSLPELPPIGSFYADDGKVKKELFDKFAQNITNSIFGVTGTQLRRIFDEVKRYDMILEMTPNRYRELEAYIHMIKSKISYNSARAIKKLKSDDENGKKAYKNLSKFISEGIDLVRNVEDYHIFVSLFEAVYGFYYEKSPNHAAK